MNANRYWTKLSNWLITRPNTAGSLVFILLLVLLSFVIKLRFNIIRENQRREMTNIINVVHHNFEQLLKNSYSTTLTLAMTIDDHGIPQNFEKVASKFVKSNDCFDAVQLVPNGVIRYIYPLKGNEAALGFDVLNTPNLKQDALKSIQTKLIHFAGPLELKQGGIGVVGRLPIFKHNKFWGFSAVMIRMETLLRTTGIHSIDASKYYFQFSKINPYTGKEEFFLANKSSFKNKYYQTVSIPDGDWKLYLIARDENGLIYQIITSITLGFLLSIISALWITALLKKPAKLELLIQQQSEKILEKQIEFKAIFEQAPTGIAKVNSQNGGFVAINKTFCELVGYSHDELIKSNFQSITHPDDLNSNMDYFEQMKLGKISHFALEKRYLHKNGKTIWVNLSVSKLSKTIDNTSCYIAIIDDITERKKDAEDLKQSFELVSEQNQRLLNFSYIVSHNLRSHTSNIETISGLLESASSDEERNEMIGLLKKVSHSLNETMANLNEVVSIRTNINLTIERLNLHDYIDNAKTVLTKQIEIKEAQIHNYVHPTVEIDYNTAYLESILLNFISNAIRYSHPNRSPEITLSFDDTKKALKISDNGIGIDMKKNGDKLFGMYKTFNNNPDSKGIGLFITKNQIDTMGGRIETESELDKGTTFTIYFK